MRSLHNIKGYQPSIVESEVLVLERNRRRDHWLLGSNEVIELDMLIPKALGEESANIQSKPGICIRKGSPEKGFR